MSSLTQPKTFLSITYSSKALKRAEKALTCAPFKLNLFLVMIDESVPLPLMAGKSGIEKDYTTKTLSENKVESELIWLIQVGLLRREVDGQGITDSFRLTPLGRQIITKWHKSDNTIPHPTWWAKLSNALNRWLRLPIN